MRAARMRCVTAALLGSLLLAPGTSALAQPAARGPTPEDKALAEALFQDGRKLFDAGQIAEACPKFAESQRLDPSAGTLLNLAICHEKEGRIASAWVELKEAASMSDAAGKPDRAEFARKRAGELETKLSRLVLEVPSPAPGMVLRLNGKELSVAAAAGTGIPVDPGEHTVEATAPGKKPWSERLVVVAEPSTKRVAIPALEDARSAPPPPPPPPKKKTLEPEVTALPPDGGGAPLRTLGFVAGGVGVVGLGVGAVFGVMTLSKAGVTKEGCDPGDAACLEGWRDAYDSGQTTAMVSNISFGVGLVGLGAGAALLLLSGSSRAPEQRTSTWIAPEVGAGGAQVRVGGRW